MISVAVDIHIVDFRNIGVTIWSAHLFISTTSQVAETCGRHALTLAIAGSLQFVKDSPNSAATWSQLASEIVRKKKTVLGPRMDADIGDDLTKRSLFPVLELSLEALGEDEQRRFLNFVVLAPGVLATIAMLASMWQKVRLLMASITSCCPPQRRRNGQDGFQKRRGKSRVRPLFLVLVRSISLPQRKPRFVLRKCGLPPPPLNPGRVFSEK